MANEPKEDEAGTGEETAAERVISNYLSTGIYLFLSVLALLLLVAAGSSPLTTPLPANFRCSGNHKMNMQFCKKLSRLFC